MGKYEMLAAQLRSQLQSDQLRPGDKLPSVTQLREEFRVAYGSVRCGRGVGVPRSPEAGESS